MLKITVGHYTRKHGSALSYDIETSEGAQRFCSRVALDCDAVAVKRFIEHIDAQPDYVQRRHWVQEVRARLVRELGFKSV
jgi:hypothetical protein